MLQINICKQKLTHEHVMSVVMFIAYRAAVCLPIPKLDSGADRERRVAITAASTDVNVILTDGLHLCLSQHHLEC